MAYGSSHVCGADAPAPNVPGVIAIVQKTIDDEGAKYPDKSTGLGYQIEQIRTGALARFKDQGAKLGAKPDLAAYAGWTQLGATIVNGVREIEGFAAEAGLPWVLEQTAIKSAADTAKLLQKAGDTVLATGKALWSWKTGVLVAGGLAVVIWWFLAPSRSALQRRIAGE